MQSFGTGRTLHVDATLHDLDGEVATQAVDAGMVAARGSHPRETRARLRQRAQRTVQHRARIAAARLRHIVPDRPGHALAVQSLHRRRPGRVPARVSRRRRRLGGRRPDVDGY